MDVTIFVTAHLHGVGSEVRVGPRKAKYYGSEWVAFPAHASVALTGNLARLAKVSANATIAALDEAKAHAAAAAAVQAAVGTDFTVKPKAIDGSDEHWWHPRLGWVTNGYGGQATKMLAFEMEDRIEQPGVVLPAGTTNDVLLPDGTKQGLRVDYLVVVAAT